MGEVRPEFLLLAELMDRRSELSTGGSMQSIQFFRCRHNKSAFTVTNRAFDSFDIFRPYTRALRIEFKRNPSVFISPSVVECEACSLN